MRVVFAAVMVALWVVAAGPAGAVEAERAIVQDDATLNIGGRIVRLTGIYIPFVDDSCRRYQRSRPCATPAALALEFKVQGFVYCRYVARYDDGSVGAYCAVRCDTGPGRCRDDLGAYLISQGWALAAPGAPFDYFARERIARHRGFGVWGGPSRW